MLTKIQVYLLFSAFQQQVPPANKKQLNRPYPALSGQTRTSYWKE